MGVRISSYTQLPILTSALANYNGCASIATMPYNIQPVPSATAVKNFDSPKLALTP